MYFAQVSRTDANALIALDPVDLTVTRKFNYTSILPEAKVGKHELDLLPVLRRKLALSNMHAIHNMLSSRMQCLHWQPVHLLLVTSTSAQSSSRPRQ